MPAIPHDIVKYIIWPYLESIGPIGATKALNALRLVDMPFADQLIKEASRAHNSQSRPQFGNVIPHIYNYLDVDALKALKGAHFILGAMLFFHEYVRLGMHH
jgi:hypothetical protein